MKLKAVLMSAVAAVSLASGEVRAEQTQELLTLRNTMVGMLEKLVASGVISEEEARSMVDRAETEALAEAERRRQEDAVAPGTVRVTYVPQVVKDEIRQEVREELRQEVTQDVIEQARTDGWGVPGAMPAWISDIEWRADVRVRGVGDIYDDGNTEGFYRDFQAINEAGGIGPAGQSALLNVSENRESMAARLRVGMDARISENWLMGMRLATGNDGNPVTRNVTAGDYSEPWELYVDLAYAQFKSDYFLFSGGRFPNPFLSTDLVFDEDITFEGLTMTGLLPFEAFGSGHRAFATLGIFPLEEVELSDEDKYLLAGQIGGQFAMGEAKLGIGVAYYDFYNVEGERNEPESVLLDYTAPSFVQKGNTLFDIRNDLDPNTGLFALAGDYDLVDVTLLVDSGPVFGGAGTDAIHVTLTGAYVTNVGFGSDDVFDRTGAFVDEKTDAYQIELAVGQREVVAAGSWRVASLFKHVERDAVLDAFTDSDFHDGGTDAEGWVLDLRYGIARNTWMRFRYLTANEIDGPPLGIDVVQLDLNTKF